MAPSRLSRCRDDGFTLIELIMVMAVAGILMAIAAPSWVNYQQAQALRNTSADLVGFLRGAQTLAVAESTTVRVDFAADGRSATMFRLVGTSYVQGRVAAPLSAAISYSAPAFTLSNGTTSTSAYFYARGTATKGQVTVARTGVTTAHVVSIEGLTGRVAQT